MNWIYSIAFKLAGTGSISQAEAAVERLDDAVDRVGEGAVSAGGKMQQMGNRGVSSFGRMMSAARSYLGVAALVATTLSSLNAASNLDAQATVIDFNTGGNGLETMTAIDARADKLGISLIASREGFKQISGALRNTSLEGQQTMDIFRGMTTAAAGSKLSGEAMNGAFLAFGQIASKGKVQAEELRGQIGERIPGAFRIAADAMGVTQSELNKMMEDGKLMSEDFLPKFAAQLEKEFAPAAMKAAEAPSASMTRFRDSVIRLQEAFGTYLLPTVSLLISDYLIPLMQYVGENIEVFMGIAKAVGLAYVAAKIYAVTVGIATLVTGGFSGAMTLLNLVMSLNPIGIVVVALAALVGGIVYAWNTSDKFRHTMKGTWEVLKLMGSWLYDGLIAPLISLGKVMVGAFTFDPAMIADGLKQGMEAATRLANRSGQDIARAYNRGYNSENTISTPFKSKALNMGGRGSLFERSDELADYGLKKDGNTGNTGRKGLSGITGRSSQRNITINLGSLVQDLKISTATAEGGTDEMEALVMRKLIQVLNTANQVQ